MIAGWSGESRLSFLRTRQAVPRSGCTIVRPRQSWGRVPAAPRPRQLLDCGHSGKVRGGQLLVSICVSLMPHGGVVFKLTYGNPFAESLADAGDFNKCLLAVCCVGTLSRTLTAWLSTRLQTTP